MTVRATFSVPGTGRQLEVIRRDAVKVDGDGPVPLDIVFLREVK